MNKNSCLELKLARETEAGGSGGLSMRRPVCEVAIFRNFFLQKLLNHQSSFFASCFFPVRFATRDSFANGPFYPWHTPASQLNRNLLDLIPLINYFKIFMFF